ncbi:DUF3343 domain-containing protein [Raoultella lignicola]|uniref:DUF3343 domain-containing protein n=1 Tax=Raoultella lignicola TaxID=3040939 RepID=A0ABU9F662_9ENTR
MTAHLFLFHSTVGVVRTRKALQTADIPFQVQDIPRQLRSGCGLCILLHCPLGEETRWVIPGQTAAIYRHDDDEWRCVSTWPA